MKPIIFKIDPDAIDRALIRQAARAIKEGLLVAFPTETVYGLGANALDADAAARIFEAKKRPLDDPLIVHISDRKDLEKLVRKVSPAAEGLIRRFWPGPLTLIFEKTDVVPDIVTTGLDTVAVRMPAGRIALSLIAEAGVPVAAPSANLFSRPSPTTAQHVVDDLDGAIDILIDGGRTRIGVESTVVGFSGDETVILRPGGVSAEEIKPLVKRLVVAGSKKDISSSPGRYATHYSPKAKVMIAEEGPDQVKIALDLAAKCIVGGRKVGVMAKKEHAAFYKDLDVEIMGPEKDLGHCASELFHILRHFDKKGKDVIIAEAVREIGLGFAIMNRLRKAAS